MLRPVLEKQIPIIHFLGSEVAFNVHSLRSLQQAIQARDRSEVENVRLPGPPL